MRCTGAYPPAPPARTPLWESFTLLYDFAEVEKSHVDSTLKIPFLSQVAFIPVNGVLTKASKLFDPRNEVLKEIFGDEPDAFPPGEFGEEAWLDVLVDVGLRNELDRETILQCARKVGKGGASINLDYREHEKYQTRSKGVQVFIYSYPI